MHLWTGFLINFVVTARGRADSSVIHLFARRHLYLDCVFRLSSLRLRDEATAKLVGQRKKRREGLSLLISRSHIVNVSRPPSKQEKVKEMQLWKIASFLFWKKKKNKLLLTLSLVFVRSKPLELRRVPFPPMIYKTFRCTLARLFSRKTYKVFKSPKFLNRPNCFRRQKIADDSWSDGFPDHGIKLLPVSICPIGELSCSFWRHALLVLVPMI